MPDKNEGYLGTGLRAGSGDFSRSALDQKAALDAVKTDREALKELGNA